MIKLLVFDLDNTLAKLGKGIIEEDLKLLKKIEKKGIRIAICSGKPVGYLCGMLRQIELEKPAMIGENGAVIQIGVDLPPKEYYFLPHSKEADRTIVFLKEKIKELLPDIWFQANDVGLTPFPKSEEEFEKIEACIRENQGQVRDVTIYRHIDSFDITPNGITKYDGLKYLGDILGILPEEVIAVGDGVNDYPMFRYAGYSVGIHVAEPDKVNMNFMTSTEALHYLDQILPEGPEMESVRPVSGAIYTVTLNPSLDYVVSVEDMKLGTINRTRKEILNPGGKGINVSLVLRNLGYESTALGFAAGFTGKEIMRLMEEQKISTDFIEVEEGLSRINVKIRSEEESELNGMGPVITEKEIQKLYEKLDQLKEGDILILAGSIPSTMPGTIYRDIMAYLSRRNIQIVVDATRELLLNVLPYQPFLIKPNNHELEEIYGVSLMTREEVLPYARDLKEKGARNVLVSMAGEGAVLLAEDGNVYMSEAPKGEVQNSVGAGDSMVAGFLAGYLENQDYEKAFFMGLCAGSASAFSEGMASKRDVEILLSKIRKGGK